MDIVDNLYKLAMVAPTTYRLEGRLAYPDEVYAPEGFLPYIARIAEIRMQRLIGGSGRSAGFNFRPMRDAVFGERLEIRPYGDGVLEDPSRFIHLHRSAELGLGLGLREEIDLTPIYKYFVSLPEDGPERSDLAKWPLFDVVPQ